MHRATWDISARSLGSVGKNNHVSFDICKDVPEASKMSRGKICSITRLVTMILAQKRTRYYSSLAGLSCRQKRQIRPNIQTKGWDITHISPEGNNNRKYNNDDMPIGKKLACCEMTGPFEREETPHMSKGTMILAHGLTIHHGRTMHISVEALSQQWVD